MNRGRAIFAWVAVALIASAIGAGNAAAEISFTAPQALGSTEAASPQIAVDPQGRATVAWVELIPETETVRVQVQRLDPTGLPGPVHTLAVVAKVPPQCVCPRVAVDGSGRATVVWQMLNSEGRTIEAAQIDASGEAGPAQALSPPEVEGWYAALAADPEGEVLVVWETSGPESRVESVLLDPAGVPGEVHPLSAPGEGRLAAPAVSPAGRFHVAWTGKDGIKTTRLDSEGVPEEIHTVSPPGEAAGVADIVVDSQGRATLAWWRGAGVYEAKAVRLAADGTPGPVWTLSPPEQNTFQPELAIDSQGQVTAVWQTFEDQIFGVHIDAGSDPGAAQQLSPEGHLASEPRLAAAADGRVVVVWTHPSYPFTPEKECLPLEWEPEDDVVRAALLDPDGQLEEIYDVSPHEQQSFGANLALDPLGLPWVAWETYDGTYFCSDWDTRAQVSHALTQPSPEEKEGGGTPKPPVVDPDPPPPTTLKLAKKGLVRNGRIAVRAKCRGAAGTFCTGMLRLKAAASHLRPPGAVQARNEKASLLLARGRYRVPGGKAKTLTFPLSPSADGLLADAGPDWIPVTARGRDLIPSSLLIRLPGGNT